MFFAGLFAMYFSLRAGAPALWESEVVVLDVPFAFINTLILVTSSFTAQFGVLRPKDCSREERVLHP